MYLFNKYFTFIIQKKIVFLFCYFSLFVNLTKIIKMLRFNFTLILTIILLVSCKQNYSHNSTSQELIKISDSIAIDKSIEEFIKPYRDSLEAEISVIIGKNREEMRSYKPESPLSSFVADIILSRGLEFLKENGVADADIPSIAVMNVRGLRTSLKPGDIIVRDIFEVMPFENNLTALYLSGEDIEHLFEHIAKANGDGLAGATCSLTSDGMKDIKIAGKPLDKEKHYWVFAPDYLANGGDSYFILQNSSKVFESNYKIRDLIIAHIKQQSSKGIEIMPDLSTRITDKRK